MSKPVMNLYEVKAMYEELCEELRYADTKEKCTQLEVLEAMWDIYYTQVTEESRISDIIDNAMVSLVVRMKSLNSKPVYSYVRKSGMYYAIGGKFIVEVQQLKHDYNGNPRFKLTPITISSDDYNLPLSGHGRNMRASGYWIIQSYNLVADLERFGRDLIEQYPERFTVDLDQSILDGQGYKNVKGLN